MNMCRHKLKKPRVTVFPDRRKKNPGVIVFPEGNYALGGLTDTAGTNCCHVAACTARVRPAGARNLSL